MVEYVEYVVVVVHLTEQWKRSLIPCVDNLMGAWHPCRSAWLR